VERATEAREKQAWDADVRALFDDAQRRRQGLFERMRDFMENRNE
jgi:hypothetical protein